MRTAGFAALGTYGLPVLILLLEALAGVCLANGFLRLKYRKRTAAARRDGREKYLELISQDGESAAVLFRAGDFCPVFATDRLESFLGFSLDALERDIKVLTDHFSREQLRALREAYRTWDRRGPLRAELQTEDRWVQLELTSSPDGDYDLAEFRDISHQKQAMEELQRRLEEAEEASKAKTTFLSRMSHEIRTPMNGITGMLSLAQNSLKNGKEAGSYLTKAQELSQHLLSLVNDILDISRIEAGKVELEEKPFDLLAIEKRLKDMFQKDIEAKGVRFSVEYQDLTVRYVVGDQLRLDQVIINFLSNAMKFTEEGEISVVFRQMLLRDGKVDLMVRVHDTGIGMAPEFIERIFRPFEQESLDTSKKYGGTGLGMAITDLIVRMMGGEIFVESLQGKGSDFTVFLRLPVAEDQSVPEEEPAAAPTPGTGEFSLRGRRILMAEDNEINAEIAVEVLEEIEGAKVDVAENGEKALERFAANPPGYYDFILMDIQMPVMDGREACRRIRGLDRPDAGRIPIFALSADAFVEDERSSMEAGMNGHFSKPIDFDGLRQKIGAFFEEQGLK